MATFHRYVVEPFPSLSCDSLISMGASGIVHTVDSSIALKSPKAYTVEMDDKDPRKEIELRRAREEEKESRREITREKAFFEILDREPHPHIIQSFFFAPEGIFMHRLQCNLELRLSPERRDNPIICRKTEIQWIKGIASGAAWLEKKGFAHGDIRPGNILLDDQENVKLCDFDCMVKMKEGLIAFNTLFLKPKEEIATSQTDLFAIASTAYNIITRNPLFHPLDLWNDDDYEEIERRLAASEFPPTNDLFCGFLIRKCWTDGYKSVADLAEEAKQIYDCTSCNETDHSHVNPQVLGENEVKVCRERCEKYCSKQRILATQRPEKKIQRQQQGQKDGRQPSSNFPEADNNFHRLEKYLNWIPQIITAKSFPRSILALFSVVTFGAVTLTLTNRKLGIWTKR